MLVVAACGDDGINKLPDAPLPPDSAVDAELQPVTLTVTDRGVPREGVVVVFQNADSTLVSRTTTDTDGVARAVLAAGGFVTALNPFEVMAPLPSLGGIEQDDLRTFAGVKPGDQLHLDNPPSSPDPTRINLVVPIDEAASAYTLWVTCDGSSYDITNGNGSGSGSGTPGGAVQLYGCGSTIDLAVETRDGDFEPLHAFVRRGVAITDGATIDLSEETYAAVADVALAYTAIPDGYSSLNTEHALTTSRGKLTTAYLGADIVGGAAEATVRRPALADGTMVTTTAFFNGSLGRQTVIDWAPAGATYALSAANLMLAEYATYPQFDSATHAWAWTSSAGVTPDLAIAAASFGRSDGKVFVGWRWQIAAPYDGTKVTLPVLPSTESQYNVRSSDDAYLDSFITAKAPGGYDAVRPYAFAPQRLIAGATGRIVVEELAQVEVLRAPARPAPAASAWSFAPQRRAAPRRAARR